jgi:hypothetical protein
MTTDDFNPKFPHSWKFIKKYVKKYGMIKRIRDLQLPD